MEAAYRYYQVAVLKSFFVVFRNSPRKQKWCGQILLQNVGLLLYYQSNPPLVFDQISCKITAIFRATHDYDCKET